MALEPVDISPGMIEVAAVWGILVLDTVAIWRLYAGPSSAPGLPHRSPGWRGGTEQLLVFGRHPALPVGIATLPIAIQRLPARDRCVVLCGAALVGSLAGMGTTSLDRESVPGRRGDTIAVAGVVGSLAMTVGVIGRGRIGPIRPWVQGDLARGGVATALMVHALPWILADLGVYAGDLPMLERVFLSRQVLPPGARGPAVHLGHHHGLDGTVIALAAVTLARTLPDVRPAPVREALSAYLALLLVYGAMRAVEDGWHEQIVKRGWTTRRIPPVVARRRPVRPRLWAGMFGAAAIVHRFWFRRAYTSVPCLQRIPPSPLHGGGKGGCGG